MKLNLYFAAPEISIGRSARLKMKWSKNSMIFMQCTNVFQKNKFSIFLIKGNNCLGLYDTSLSMFSFNMLQPILSVVTQSSEGVSKSSVQTKKCKI